MKTSRLISTLLPVLLLSTIAPSVLAQQVIQDRTESAGPNRAMLHSGIWTLGLSYVPALVVATESSRHGDKNLYIPVAGPWLDMAERNPCPAGASCSNETTNKVLLVVDGVFQGIGALDIVGSFLFPESRTVTTSAKNSTEMHVAGLTLRLSPSRFEGGYGVSAFGRS